MSGEGTEAPRQEVNEQVEQKEQNQRQVLNETTQSPESRVEKTQDYPQAEDVEQELQTAIENTEAAVNTAGQQPGGDVAATPINLPNPVENQTEGGSGGRTGGDVAATPINLPNPVETQVEEQVTQGTEQQVRTSGQQPGGDVAATPINLPNVAGEVSPSPVEPTPPPDQTAEITAEKHTEGTEQAVRTAGQQPGGDVAATPINLPNVADDGSELMSGDGVSATPINLPNPVETQVEGQVIQGTEQQVRTAGQQPGGDVAATPINLPRVAQEADPSPVEPQPPPDRLIQTPREPGSENAEDPDHGPNPFTDTALAEETVRTAGQQPGGDVAATPINLPRVAEELEPHPIDPPPPPDQVAEVGLIGEGQEGMQAGEQELDPTPLFREGETGGEAVAIDPNPLFRESEDPGEAATIDPTPIFQEGEETENFAEEEPEAGMEEGPENAQDPETEMPDPEDVPEAEDDSQEGTKEGQEKGGDWYIHEDSEGNLTVVDADGKPVKSPPVLYKVNGKVYAAYPGDKPAFDSSGKLKDPSQLVEYKYYQAPVKDTYLHQTKDGKTIVVDKNGNPLDSQPTIVTYQGKQYAVYPGQDMGVDENGKVTDPAKLKQHQLTHYQAPINGLYMHQSEDGSLTVVDKNGKPLASQPTIVTYQGKQYAVYPGQDAGVDATGKITDPAKLKQHQLSYYQASVKDLYVHESGDGKVTVVDQNGKPLDSPPMVVTYQGKQYAVYPGQDAGVDAAGKITDPAKLKKHQISYYQKPIKDMYIHDDGQGNLTVVDKNGKPVDSPPAIVNFQGQSYLSYPGTDPGVAEDGTITDPSKLKSLQANYFQTSTEDMRVHEDNQGNLTVVDKHGNPVDSPPIIVEYQGKLYATYPGVDSGIDENGKITDPKKFKGQEIKHYKPSWWNKKNIP